MSMQVSFVLTVEKKKNVKQIADERLNSLLILKLHGLVIELF